MQSFQIKEIDLTVHIPSFNQKQYNFTFGYDKYCLMTGLNSTIIINLKEFILFIQNETLNNNIVIRGKNKILQHCKDNLPLELYSKVELFIIQHM